MDIVVCIKQVPDTEELPHIRVNPETNTLVRESVKGIINPFDENAIEEALRLREANGGKVTVVSVGSEEAKVILKKCLAMGADEAVLVNDTTAETYDGLRTAKIIAQALKKKFPDYSLILFGKQSVGVDNAQIPAMVAEFLGLPQVNVVTRLEIEENKGIAHREIEGALEKTSFSLPAVISAQKGLNEPRYETLKGIMMAKRKEIPVFSLQELGLEERDLVPQLEIIKMASPPPRKAGRKIEKEPNDAAKELAEFLHQEANVI